MAKAYNAFLDDEFRVNRDGHLPVVTKRDLDAYFAKDAKVYTYRTIGGKVASSRDLAFTYGSFHLGGSQEAAGYYVHVWRKDGRSRWRLVADVLNELPKK